MMLWGCPTINLFLRMQKGMWIIPEHYSKNMRTITSRWQLIVYSNTHNQNSDLHWFSNFVDANNIISKN
jgi:hypothetical protein